MRPLLLSLVIAVAIYVAICVVLYVAQRSMIYHPQPIANITGVATSTFIASRRVGSAEPILKIQYSEINGSVSAAQPQNTAIIYFAGNAEHAGYAAADLARLFRGHSVYALHYRGYAGSEGSPSEANLTADAIQLYSLVSARHKDVVVIGRSLGSGVAVQIAAQVTTKPPTKLVMLTPYDSIQNVAAKQFPIFPIRLLIKDKFESWRYAPLVKSPTLVLTAESDQVIRRERTEALLPHFAAGLVTSKTIANTDHNSIVQSPEYVKQLITFVGQ